MTKMIKNTCAVCGKVLLSNERKKTTQITTSKSNPFHRALIHFKFFIMYLKRHNFSHSSDDHSYTNNCQRCATKNCLSSYFLLKTTYTHFKSHCLFKMIFMTYIKVHIKVICTSFFPF